VLIVGYCCVLNGELDVVDILAQI